MAYRALRRLYVGTDDDGQPVYREYGELVPEAEEWNWMAREAYVNQHHIRYEPDPVPVPAHTHARAKTKEAS